MSKKDIYKDNKQPKNGEIPGNWLSWYFKKKTLKVKHKNSILDEEL